ncbi:17472_t:CDS:2, partial [Racocetra persica]
MNNINQATSGLKTSTTSTTKGIAKALDTINGHQASENIDETSFTFNLEKPPGDQYNHERLNNYIKFYLEDYIKRNEDL